MKIGVVGAGGMGSTYGGRLAAAGEEVWLADVFVEHVERVNREGLLVEGPEQRFVARPRAVCDARAMGPCDLVIVFVKSMHTAEVAPLLPELLRPGGMVLTLQNGYGNAEIIAEAVGVERVLAGVSYRSAELLGPGHVRENGLDRETVLGPLTGGECALGHAVVDSFNRAGLVARYSADVRSEIWGKLLVNVAGNAMCAVLDLSIGQLARNGPALELVDLLIGEVVRLIEVRGIRLPYPDPYEKVRKNWEGLEAAFASTHQDIRRGRPTEIDALNGAIVRESEREGLDAPYNRALTLLVHALEQKQALKRDG